MDPQVQVMLDKQEIHDVLMRYCRGCDRMDKELLSSVFHPDAMDEHGGDEAGPLVFVGARIADDFEAALDGAGLRNVQHLIGNVLVEVDGDVAFSESYFNANSMIERDGTMFFRVRAGRYLDRFERRHGSWKIAHRVVIDDWSRLDELVARPAGTSFRVGKRAPEDPSYHVFGDVFRVAPSQQ